MAYLPVAVKHSNYNSVWRHDEVHLDIFHPFPIVFIAESPVSAPILEIKDNVIVIQKGKDLWEVARDKDTRVKG